MFFIRTASAADPRGRLLDGRRARLSDLFRGRLLGLLQELTDGYLQFGLTRCACQTVVYKKPEIQVGKM